MKLNRNDICNCGSGLKFKKCCMSKSNEPEHDRAAPIETILSNTRFGLENLHLLGGSNRKIRIRKVDILNHSTLVCEFYPYEKNSPDIKGEICTIMGFFNGFLLEDKSIHFKNYAVKAFDEGEQMILYALSSRGAVHSAGVGDAIEWLKATLFQENTNDYRLSMAKRIISEIENSLRHVAADILEKQFHSNWWDLAMDSKLGDSVKEIYRNQFGVATSDGSILINYTYTIQLKKIITTHWPYFKQFFGDKIEFENSMDELNIIHREEAHNRIVSASHIESLGKIYSSILEKILSSYQGLTPAYLIENWKLQVSEIMRDEYEPLYKPFELTDEPDPEQKLKKSIKATEHLISYLTDTNHKLNSVVVPIQKKSLHNELVQRLDRYKTLQEEKLNLIDVKNWHELETMIKSIERHEMELKSFTLSFLSTEG